MKEQSLQLSDIRQQILKVLQNHPTPESLKNKHFLNELDVILLIKRPITHTFICDLNISIQIQFKDGKSKLQEYDLNPYNKIMTHYYQVTHDHTKYFYSLNCTDRTLFDKYNIKTASMSETFHNDEKGPTKNISGGMFPEQNSQSLLQNIENDYIPHPYEPLYYFPRNIFEKFIKNRNNLTMTVPLRKIRIYDWVLKVVNISKSREYSFMIEVHRSQQLHQQIRVDGTKKQKGKFQFQLKNIESILYDQKFQSILENMRLKHVRQLFAKQNLQDQDSVSMCYHLRNHQQSHKLPKVLQFVELDDKGQILKFNKENQAHPVSYVPIGQLSGLCYFPQPINLNKQQKLEQLRQLNAFSMKGLYEILHKEKGSKKISIQKLKKNRKQKIGNQNFAKMIEQRLQNSYLRICHQKKQNISSTFERDQNDSLWSDSQAGEQQADQNDDEEVNQGDYVRQYSNILNDGHYPSEESSSDEQNEYFKRYRQETRKQFMK